AHGVLNGVSSQEMRSLMSNCAGCDFEGLDLSGHDLHEVRIAGSNLRDVNLENANLQGAHLHGDSLHGARLHGANLRDASLSGSNLEGAHLSGADLRGAELLGAQARSVDFTGADLDGAVLCGVSTTIDEDSHGNRTVTRGKTVCADLAGANFKGAKVRNIQRCEWQGRDEARTCTEVPAQMLRDVAHADLSGAIL
nr:pentapeptide repeat-containing protein [Candidatus Eremiobacteraeota bacterium]